MLAVKQGFGRQVVATLCWWPLIQRLLRRIRWERMRPEVGATGPGGMIGVRSTEDRERRAGDAKMQREKGVIVGEADPGDS